MRKARKQFRNAELLHEFFDIVGKNAVLFARHDESVDGGWKMPSAGGKLFVERRNCRGDILEFAETHARRQTVDDKGDFFVRNIEHRADAVSPDVHLQRGVKIQSVGKSERPVFDRDVDCGVAGL